MIAALLTPLFWPFPMPPARAQAAPGTTTMSDARFGTVDVRVATAGSAGTVVLWLDGGGAAHVLPRGNDVTTIRVSAKEYVSRSAPHHGRCFYPAADLEGLAQDVEKRIGWSRYAHPVVAGDGAGATLAIQSLESAPEGTFAGALAAGFSPKIALPSAFCRGDGPRASFDGKTARLEPPKEIAAPFVLVQGTKDRTFTADDARTFAADSRMEVVEVDGAGHDVTSAPAWADAVARALARVSAPRPEPLPSPSAVPTPTPTPTVTPTPSAEPSATPVAVETPPLANADVRDLPLHDVRPPENAVPDDRVQILLTGDGGWAGIDRGIASGFAAQGMRTIGWDSLAFFWKKKSPDDVARALARIVDSLPAGTRVIATGFSFGADVMPFAVNRLPERARSRIAAVVLIAPSKEASFEIHPLDWLLDASHRGDLATPPELAKLDMPVVCLVPKDDRHSPCRDIPRFTVVESKPGHHLGGDYAAVARSILAAMDQVVPPEAATTTPAPAIATTNGAPAATPEAAIAATNGALAGAAAGAALAQDAVMRK